MDSCIDDTWKELLPFFSQFSLSVFRMDTNSSPGRFKSQGKAPWGRGWDGHTKIQALLRSNSDKWQGLNELATSDIKNSNKEMAHFSKHETTVSDFQTRDIQSPLPPPPLSPHLPQREPQEEMVWTFRSNGTNWVLLATYLKYIDCNSLSSLKTTVIHSCSSWSVKQCTTPSSVKTTIICRQMPHLSTIVLGYVITYVSLKQQKVKCESWD